MTDQTVFLFPGQGSQYVGMGKDLVDAFVVARETFAEADESLGFALSKMCFDGPEEDLNDTFNTQPAILAVSIAVLRALRSEGWTVSPSFVAGHSMGEYSALVAADALSFSDALRLVRERGRLTKVAGEQRPGGMAAILKLDAVQLDEICEQASRETGGEVQVANYNAPGQIVISGTDAALDRAIELAQAAGARRARKLAVSAAFHSPLMSPILDEFRQKVDAAAFGSTQVPIVSNVTARPITTVEEMKDELILQLTSSVRWIESVEWMAQRGVSRSVEFGPKDVVSGLVRKIDVSIDAVACGTVEGVQSLLAA
jgi:[acyl-carrier-protein] S-malonyltransferase